jgi:hypothetical protein
MATPQEPDFQIPPSIRAAMAFLRHADIVRAPPQHDSAMSTPGRELHPAESATERAALRLLRAYFNLNYRQCGRNDHDTGNEG